METAPAAPRQSDAQEVVERAELLDELDAR